MSGGASAWRARLLIGVGTALLACAEPGAPPVGPDASPGPVDASVSDANVDARDGELRWERGSDCPVARFEAVSLMFRGEVWVLGGFVSERLAVTRRVDIYDPERDSWRRGPDLPGAETHFGIVVDGDDLLCFGGFSGWEDNAMTDAVWRLSGGVGEWTSELPLPMPSAAFAWTLLGRELHVAGGLEPDNQRDQPAHWVRDLGAEPSWRGAAELPDPRNHGGGVTLGGLFYAVAGRHAWDEQAGHSTSLHAYDPASDRWEARAPMPIARSEIGASTLTTGAGRIVTVGGSVAGTQPSRSVFEYDPARDRWRALTDLPEARKGAVAARVGERLIVTTGSPTSTDPSASTFIGCCLE